MIVFLDTSAWIKYFIEEKGTSEIQKFLYEKSGYSDITFSASAVTYAEIIATTRRAFKSKRISLEQYNQIINEFKDQWENIDIPLVDKLFIEKSGELAEKFA